MLQAIASRLQKAQQSQQNFVRSPQGRAVANSAPSPAPTPTPISNDSSARVAGAGMQAPPKTAITSPNPTGMPSTGPAWTPPPTTVGGIGEPVSGYSNQVSGMPGQSSSIEQAIAMMKAAQGSQMQLVQQAQDQQQQQTIPYQNPMVMGQSQQQMHDVMPPNANAGVMAGQTQQMQPYNMTQNPEMMAALQRRMAMERNRGQMQMGANG